MEERRKFRRHRTLKGGRLCFGGTAIDCIIRDISEGGAKLSVPNVLGIPSEIVLAFEDKRPSLRSFVMWRRLNVLGVEFARDITQAPLARIAGERSAVGKTA